MTDTDDPLAHQQVALTAALTTSGVSVKAQSRFVGAVDSLLGRGVDLVSARLEGIARRQRARDDASVDLIKATGARAVETSSEDDEAAQVLLERLVRVEARKLLHRRDVVSRAVEELKSLPAPEALAADAGQEDEEPDTIDADWLNVFGDYVDRASSERLRSLWGRILAGEIRRAGSFSLTTLRMISELDKDIAEKFQSWVELRLREGLVPRVKALAGQELLDGLFLEELGLVGQIEPALSFGLKGDDRGLTAVEERTLALMVETNGPNQEVAFPITQLTRVGREIATILPPTDEEAVLLAVAELLRPKVKTLQFGWIRGRQPGTGLILEPIRTV